MKEQDYMNIMGAIRGEYLEEAVSWDGSERRRIRQIRRMTVSFGAVAAALAVVVGMIAYKANRDKIDTANSDTESSIVDDPETTQNLYGGHGELRQISGANGTICYDDDYVYEGDARWSVRSGGKVVRLTEDQIPDNLFMDGENLFTVHDGQIFETDSFGKETVLIDISAFQFPMQLEPAQICGLQKLSDRLLCIEYNENAQYPTLLIADLQNSMAYQQDDPTFCALFPDSEISYYAFSAAAGTLARYELSVGSLSKESIRNMDAYTDFGTFAVRDGKFYTTAKQYQIGEADPETMPEQYLSVDLKTGEVTEETFSLSERICAGNAFIRSAYENGKFCLYRRGLDRMNEQLVFSVPFEQYLDTAKYGTPDVPSFLSVYESDDMIIAHLPLMCNDIPCPAKHGEDGVLIDLKTGKVLYYGDNYDYSTPDDSSLAEGIVTTVISGGTGVTGTGTSAGGTGTETTAKAAAQTTAAAGFTVADGANVFGGSGRLFALGNGFWRDNREVYEIGQSGSRYTADANGNLTRAGVVCRKAGCNHDNESCPFFHYNIEGIRSNPNSTAYDGQNASLLSSANLLRNEMWIRRGRTLYRVNQNTGDETAVLQITQIENMTLTDNDLEIFSISELSGRGGTATGKYLLNCGVGLDVAGRDPDAIYLILADMNSGTQRLVAKVGSEGSDSDGIMWGNQHQDLADSADVFVLQNDNVLLRFDSGMNRIGSYTIPAADGEKPCANAWCVVRNVMWYLNEKGQWCSFDLNTRTVTVVKENAGVVFHEQGSPECFCFDELGMFFAVTDQRKLMMFRYDMADSEVTNVEFDGLLFEQCLNLSSELTAVRLTDR